MITKPPNLPGSTADADIVLLLLSRDSDGLHELLTKYGGKVMQNLRYEMGCALDALDLEEVLNRAAYLAWRHAASYSEERGKLGTWFYIIARNAAVQLLRSESRARGKRSRGDLDFSTWTLEQGTALGPGAASIAAASGKTSEPSPSSERQTRFVEGLRACIAQLTPLQQQIIRADLQSGEVVDAGELARTLNTSKNSIYVSRSNARKQLRRAMQRMGFFGGEQSEQMA